MNYDIIYSFIVLKSIKYMLYAEAVTWYSAVFLFCFIFYL